MRFTRVGGMGTLLALGAVGASACSTSDTTGPALLGQGSPGDGGVKVSVPYGTADASTDGGGDGGDGGGNDGGSLPTADGGPGSDGGAEVMPTALPTVTGTCPSMANLDGGVATFAGQDVTVWSGDPAKGPGPLLLYWYATGSSPSEAPISIGSAQMATILAKGGVVAAQNQTTSQGGTTGNDIWYQGDVTIADQVVACAVKNQRIDVRHISSLGYSAGALQSTYMWFARSGYIASVVAYSGGEDGLDQVAMQDPAHPPAAVVAHGAEGSDVYGSFDFYDASVAWEKDLVAAGAFTVDCDDGGAHTDYSLRTSIAPEAFQLLVDHPYGVSPEPYTALPATWPTYCTIRR